jgi:coenzyme F420-reducing hydrogenase gamma subunit
MTAFNKCSGCGRRITTNYNIWESGEHPLCSFCAAIVRKTWNQKQEKLKNEQLDKFVYCLGCGVKHRKLFNRYCFECDKKRVKMLEQIQ